MIKSRQVRAGIEKLRLAFFNSKLNYSENNYMAPEIYPPGNGYAMYRELCTEYGVDSIPTSALLHLCRREYFKLIYRVAARCTGYALQPLQVMSSQRA